MSITIEQLDECRWRIPRHGAMHVDGLVFASARMMQDLRREQALEQVCNVATLPGIVKASYAMPDAHWGYGFPIGGVAAFDAEAGGVVSAGGVGFDISCGVRTLSTGLRREQIESRKRELADTLFAVIPAGVGSTGRLHLNAQEMHAMLSGGARWAVQQGFGTPQDLERIEEHGRMAGAQPEAVSDHAKKRQRDEMGTLGSGNHYLEVQEVVEHCGPLPSRAAVGTVIRIRTPRGARA